MYFLRSVGSNPSSSIRFLGRRFLQVFDLTLTFGNFLVSLSQLGLKPSNVKLRKPQFIGELVTLHFELRSKGCFQVVCPHCADLPGSGSKNIFFCIMSVQPRSLQAILPTARGCLCSIKRSCGLTGVFIALAHDDGYIDCK